MATKTALEVEIFNVGSEYNSGPVRTSLTKQETAIRTEVNGADISFIILGVGVVELGMLEVRGQDSEPFCFNLSTKILLILEHKPLFAIKSKKICSRW